MRPSVDPHPELDLHIAASAELMDTDTMPPQLTEDILRKHHVDIAVRFGRGYYPGCDVEPLMQVVALPHCFPTLLQDHSRPLSTPANLANHTLLHDETPYEGRPDQPSWLQAIGVESVDGTRGLYVNRLSLALAAAVQAQGVVLSLKQLAMDDLTNGRLVVPFGREVEFAQGYYVISQQHTGSARAEHIMVFRRWLMEEAAIDINTKRSQQQGPNFYCETQRNMNFRELDGKLHLEIKAESPDAAIADT